MDIKEWFKKRMEGLETNPEFILNKMRLEFGEMLWHGNFICINYQYMKNVILNYQQ
jgi:hypothetical protein